MRYAVVFLACVLSFRAYGSEVFDKAVDESALYVASSIARDTLPGEKVLFLAPFRSEVLDAPCEPLSTLAVDLFQSSLLRYKSLFNIGFSLTKNFREASIFGTGKWLVKGGDEVLLTVEIGSFRNEKVRVLESKTFSFSRSSLPTSAVSCLFFAEERNELMKVLSDSEVRSGPSVSSDRLDVLPKDAEARVVGKIRDQDWLLVRMDDDPELPAGMNERYGFLFFDNSETGRRKRIEKRIGDEIAALIPRIVNFSKSTHPGETKIYVNDSTDAKYSGVEQGKITIIDGKDKKPDLPPKECRIFASEITGLLKKALVDNVGSCCVVSGFEPSGGIPSGSIIVHSDIDGRRRHDGILLETVVGGFRSNEGGFEVGRFVVDFGKLSLTEVMRKCIAAEALRQSAKLKDCFGESLDISSPSISKSPMIDLKTRPHLGGVPIAVPPNGVDRNA